MNFSISGLDELALTLEKLSKIPDEVLDDMTRAGGHVLEKHVYESGEKMGVRRTGATLDSITMGNPKTTATGKSVYVTFKGKNRDGNRNAEVAFINEFGRKNQASRPFVEFGTKAAADEATAAAAAEYEKWLDSLK